MNILSILPTFLSATISTKREKHVFYTWECAVVASRRKNKVYPHTTTITAKNMIFFKYNIVYIRRRRLEDLKEGNRAFGVHIYSSSLSPANGIRIIMSAVNIISSTQFTSSSSSSKWNKMKTWVSAK